MKTSLFALFIIVCSFSLHAAETDSRKIYNCQYMKNPPFGVDAWSQSKIVSSGKNKENRFLPYNSKAANGLILDATAVREIYKDQSTKGRETLFYMFYNERGWYIYIQCDEPKIEEYINNNKDIALEIFFCPGMHNVPYYQMIVHQLTNKTSFYDWGMPHRDYRSLKDRIRVEAMPIKAGFGTFLFVPWSVLYDRLPLNGDLWRFSLMRWGPSMTWGGKVHDTGNFGLVKFQKPSPEVKAGIMKGIERYAKAKFKRDAKKAVWFWSDEKVGDPEFYNKILKPLLDKYAASNPADSTVVKNLMELPYNISELRSEYLLKKLLPVKASKAIDNSLFKSYVVPPLSSFKRLPDRIPYDAVPSSELRMVAARGEYEPASFVLAPKQNVKKLTLKPSDLSSSKGKISASDIDIKIVKCWYQAGTAWYSYFADNNRRELVPELLLKDETLIKVDMDKKENYLRVNGKYQWISYPKSEARKAFNYLTTKVADSKSLKAVKLIKNENKQFWITVKVAKNTAPGIYKGKINLIADGRKAGAMELALKVLPFELPMPKTYYNINNPYLVTIYGTGIYDIGYRFGIKQSILDKMQMAIYKNVLKHNVFNCRSDLTIARHKDRPLAIERLKHEIAMLKKAGFVTKPLLSRGWSFPISNYSKAEVDQKFKTRIDDLVRTFKETLGHTDVYITSWDEASERFVKVMRKFTEYTSSQGLKIWMTTHKGRHFDLAGYLIDYANHGGWPERSRADMWHSVGSKVTSYAGPHTGPENPDVFRRWEGLARYKANYDGSFNYILFSGLHPTLYKRYKSNVWNDFMGDAFRNFNIVYPTTEGLIDTLAWEGFREGIDDVRYATKLKQLAATAIAGGNYKAGHAAKKALMWLELLDERKADLNSVRLEIIEYISKIQDAMKK